MSDTSDPNDLASKHEAQHISLTIKRVSAAQQARSLRPSLTRCLECGDKIPDKRREAEPGCEMCVKCKSWQEKGGFFWP